MNDKPLDCVGLDLDTARVGKHDFRLNSADPVSTPEEKQPFYVHCKTCGHEWVWFFAPILMDVLAKFKPHPCQKCHSEKVVCGRAPALTPSAPAR